MPTCWSRVQAEAEILMRRGSPASGWGCAPPPSVRISSIRPHRCVPDRRSRSGGAIKTDDGSQFLHIHAVQFRGKTHDPPVRLVVVESTTSLKNLPRFRNRRQEKASRQIPYVRPGDPHIVPVGHLSSMYAAKFAEFDTACGNFLSRPNDRRPSRRLLDPFPGHRCSFRQIAQPVHAFYSTHPKRLRSFSCAKAGNRSRRNILIIRWTMRNTERLFRSEWTSREGRRDP